VQIDIDAANAGDMISAEEVEAEAAAWRAGVRRKLVQPDQGTSAPSNL